MPDIEKPSALPPCPALYGHRGLGGTPFENTLAGFERALDQGADGVELDVRVCQSGELVVMHDEDLMRTAGRPERVADLSCDALARIPLQPSGAPIPSLQEAIDAVRGRGGQLNIELKTEASNVATAVTALAAVVRARSGSDREGLLISSFDLDALRALHTRGIDRLAYLVDRAVPAEALPAWLFALHPGESLVTSSTLADWRLRGLQVNVWTVNDPDAAVALSALSVDGLITDDVPALRQALAR